MNNTSLGQRIRMARKELGMTQHELAEGIVTSSMICQIENGKAFPSYPVLSGLAARMNKPIEYFVSDTDAAKHHRSSFTLAKALMASGSYEKAYSLLKSIQDNGQSDTEDFHLTLSECCQHLGKYEAAAAQLDEMLTVAISQGDHKRAFTLLQRLGEVAEAGGQHQLSLYHWQKALETLDKTDIEPATRSRLLTLIGNTYYKLGYVEEALQYLQQAYELRETFLSLEELGSMYLSLALSYRDSNDLQKASYFSEQAYTIFKSVTNMKMTTDVKRSLAVVLAKQGQGGEALEILNECIEIYSRSQDTYNIARTQIEMAHVHQLGGEIERAMDMIIQAMPLLEADEVETARAHRLLADLHHARGSLPDAVTHLNRSVQLYQKQGDSVGMMEAMNLSVELYKQWEMQTAQITA